MDDTKRIHTEERIVGRRATFHVYTQTPSGRTRTYDVSYAADPHNAAIDVLAGYRELGSRRVLVRVVACDQSITL